MATTLSRAVGLPLDVTDMGIPTAAAEVERANSHLKDWFRPSKMMVRGYSKVNFTLMAGILCLAAVKILQYFILPVLDSAA